MSRSDIPLVVDLDGTLIRTDLLLESLYAMLRQEPVRILNVPLWLLKGKAHLKDQISQRSHIDEKTLPYHAEFLSYLRKEHQQGRRIVLATASSSKFARAVAQHLGIFTDVLASDNTHNLSGKNKLKVLVKEYGEKGFDYAGNEGADLHIFPHARKAILVNPSGGVLAVAQKSSQVEQVFVSEKKNSLRLYLKAMRLYQWVKNILLFVPLVTSHSWNESTAVTHVLLGFLSFGLCASGGYIFNDLLDLGADRSHPRKKARPFASGEASIWSGSVLMVVLQLGGLAIAAAMDLKFFGLLALYCVISLSYTFHLKTYVLIDVIVLAALYTLRVLAGSVLADAPLSFWLLAFSIFLFFSLALIKRCSELVTLAAAKTQYAGGRDYSVSDLASLREMGVASGYLAVMIVALYINSPEVSVLYSRPQVLWMICPVLLYWISRLWLKTGRGEMADDPIVFSIKDKGSRFIAMVMVLIVLLAI